MRTSILIVILAALAALACSVLGTGGTGGSPALAAPQDPPKPPAVKEEAEEDEEGEENITLDQAPEPVRKAILAILGGAPLKNLSREVEEGFTLYEATYEKDGSRYDTTFSAGGVIVEMERTIDAATLQAAVREAIQKKYPEARITRAEDVQLHYYALLLDDKGRKREVDIYPTGRVKEEE